MVVTYIWQPVARQLRASRFLHGVVMLAGGTALGQALAILASPIITRLYSPEDLGVLSIFVSILSVLAVIATLRYELAIPLPKDDERAGELLFVSLIAALIVPLLAAALLGFLGDRLVSWTNTPDLRRFLWLIPVGLLASGLHQALLYWAIRKRAYSRLARTRLARSASTTIVQVGLGLTSIGAIGLVLGEVVGRLSGTLTLARLALSPGETRARWTTLRGTFDAAIAHYRFPLLSSGSAILNAAGLHLPPVMLAVGYGPHIAGLFALAQRVIDAPTRMVGTAVADVYIAEAATLARTDPKRLRWLFAATSTRLALSGGIPIAAGGLASPWIFGLVFGSGWREAGVYVQLLSLYYASRFVVVPLSQTLNILNRQDLQFLWDTMRLLLAAASLLGGAWLGWPATMTIGLFGVASCLAYSGLFALSAREVARAAQPEEAQSAPESRQATIG